MQTSRNIAALLGPLLLASGAMLLLNLGAMPQILHDLGGTPTLVLLAGYMTFMPGVAIVHWHNRWSAGWPVLVTALGWLFVVIGLIRILLAYHLPRVLESQGQIIVPAMPWLATVMLAIGAYLSFQGFRRS